MYNLAPKQAFTLSIHFKEILYTGMTCEMPFTLAKVSRGEAFGRGAAPLFGDTATCTKGTLCA
jgi:hypothetical protein